MIKSEIRSLIKNLCNKYEEIERYHDRVIDAVCEETINQMLWELWASDPLSIQRYVKKYGYATPIAVLYEATTHLYYSLLPTAIVPFRDRASGVRRISTVVQGGVSFYPMDSRESDLIQAGSFVDTVTAIIGYSVTDRIEYYNMTATVIAAGVRADLIVPFSVYTDSETVLLPEFKDGQGESFMDRVLKNLYNIPPAELNENKQFEETKK